MTHPEITREALVAAASRHHRQGISAEQAVVIGYSELAAEPLDPFSFDDAAVILRAERLVTEGLKVAEAIDTARHELVTWNLTRRETA